MGMSPYVVSMVEEYLRGMFVQSVTMKTSWKVNHDIEISDLLWDVLFFLGKL